MYNILLIEDDPNFQVLVNKAVSNHTTQVLVANTTQEGFALLQSYPIHLILLEVTLPDRNGFDWYAEIQENENFKDILAVFLTVRGEVSNKVTAFSLGAEDYWVKPMQPLELRVRIEAKLRKIQQKKAINSVIRKGNLTLHLAFQKAYLIENDQERTLKLTPTEFRILHYLARLEEHVLTRNQILAEVWGNDSNVFDRTVDAHVSALRKKLSPYSGCIESILGEGYRFLSPKKLESI